VKALLAIALALAGCKSLAYQCASDVECRNDGVDGACEANGFCSFPDSSCTSGRRYGEWAGNSLGNQCVTGGSEPDSMMPPEDAMIDAKSIDAPASSITKTFGETGNAMHSGVTIDAEFADGQTNNSGTGDHTSVDLGTTEVGLYRFNISVIPTGSTVISARVELSTANDGNIYQAGQAQLFRLLEQWDETTVTAVMRNATDAWTTANANAPGSRDPTPIGSFTPTAENRYMINLPVAVVQGWVTNPATNCGFVVDTANSTGHLHLASKEHATAARRALLVVTYFPP
jgi:hypothetical protein